jgi:NIPSNAP
LSKHERHVILSARPAASSERFVATSATLNQSEEKNMFFELRQYRIKDGERERWVKFMEEEIIPFQVERGMVIVGSWIDQEAPDHYIWLRRFESEEQRKALYQAVYEDPKWNNEFKPRIDEMLDRTKMIVTRLEATPKSVIR